MPPLTTAPLPSLNLMSLTANRVKPHPHPAPTAPVTVMDVEAWQPNAFYNKDAVVEFEEKVYRSTGPHLSGESLTPSKNHAQWTPVPPPNGVNGITTTQSEPDAPPPSSRPTHVDKAVQTVISFPSWVANSWPLPAPLGSHALAYPWAPPPTAPPQLQQHQQQPQPQLPLLPPPTNTLSAPPPQQQQQQQPQPQPRQQHIHAPMPLHLPLRLPPALESVLAPIADPLDARYRAARTAERAQQRLSTFRAEVAGERVVRTHACGAWAYSGARDRQLEAEREAAWRDCGSSKPEAWLRSARARRAAYAVPGAVRPPVRWVLVEEGQRLPDDALQTGEEGTGEALYSTRVWWKGGLHLGKAAHHIYNGASISWDSQEHTTPTFEILCGSPAHVRWLEIPHGSRTSPSLAESFEPVEGGREAHGAFIFVSQGEYGLGMEYGRPGLHPGKAGVGDDHACIGYGGGEVWVRPFRVLVYAQ